MSWDLLIHQAHVVFTDKVMQADVAVKNGTIAAVAPVLSGDAKKTVHAAGHYLFPGAIDIHVHFNDPGRTDWEGFASGSKMLAAGGITTFFDMPLNGIPSTINAEALRAKKEKAGMDSLLDFGLWGGLVPGNIQDLQPLAEAGVAGFKAFLSPSGNEAFEAADDETLLQGMYEIARLGKILALHAESAAITEVLRKQKEAAGTFSADDYAETRPIAAETEAVSRALTYASLTGCRLHFVHISSAEALALIADAKKDGLDVSAETCPHYLLFQHQHLIEKGPAAKCAPPLRSAEDQQRLIQALLDGKIDMIASDHSPSAPALKKADDIFYSWGGISGGQFTLLSMIELALDHHIPLERVAQLTSFNPAQRFGLTEKGEIAEGKAADFSIVSLMDAYTATPANYYAQHKQSLYLEHHFPCRILSTYQRGVQIFHNDEFPVHVKGKWQPV